MSDIISKLLEQDENVKLDFKLELPLERNKQRKEFAKDICCFANTEGGYIIVGVEDKTKERIGISPGSLDTKMIMKVGRERINPPVHSIEASEIENEGVTYGFIEIKKTNRVHQTDGVVFVRKIDDCLQADPGTISDLDRKASEYAIEETRRIRERELDNFPEIESKRAEEILEMLLEKFYGDGLLERFDTKRREKRWILRRRVGDELKSFLKACSVTIDTKSAISESFRDILRMRAIGLLAMAQLENDPTVTEKTRLVLEYEPTLANEDEDEQSAMFLFDWADKFRNEPRSAFDPSSREGLGIAERAIRIEKQLRLQNELLELTKEVSTTGINPFTMLWAMLIGLVADSISDLSAGKSKWAERLQERVKKGNTSGMT